MTLTPVWQRMQEDMQLAGLAARTQESYLGAVHRLADHAQKAPDQLTEADLRQYFLYLRTERKLSRSSLLSGASLKTMPPDATPRPRPSR